MARVSPTLEGFRAAWRRPSVIFAEIAWRWSTGTVASGLFFFWLFEYLDTLPVSNSDASLLSTRHPALVGRAITHILRGSLNRAVLSALVAMSALVLLWIVVASIGRAATVGSLIDYFRRHFAIDVSREECDAKKRRSLLSLAGLSFLRAALALAAILALVGASVLVSFVSPKENPQPGWAFILFLPLAGFICFLWSSLNWLLSLAGMFVVRDGEETLGALSAAVSFFRRHFSAVFAVSTWTGLAHLTAFSMAGTALSIPLAFVQVVPTRLLMAALIVIGLIYFAVADWLYVVRLAGYVCIAEMPEATPEAAPLPVPPPQTVIDRDEPILSDIPNLAVEP